MGPTSFEFVVPPNVPIKISPAVGTVEPEKVNNVDFILVDSVEGVLI